MFVLSEYIYCQFILFYIRRAILTQTNKKKRSNRKKNTPYDFFCFQCFCIALWELAWGPIFFFSSLFNFTQANVPGKQKSLALDELSFCLLFGITQCIIFCSSLPLYFLIIFQELVYQLRFYLLLPTPSSSFTFNYYYLTALLY